MSFPQGSRRGFLVPLTQGKFTLIDWDDVERVIEYKWCFHCGYAQRGKRNGKHKETIHLSHFIIGSVCGQKVDHINGDKLDNRKSNLRVCTQAQNVMNTGKRKDNTSGFKGVSPYKNKWRAYIQVNHQWKHIGYFNDPQIAALAYDRVAKELHGEYARTNF